LIDIKAPLAGSREPAVMQRFPPAQNGPHYELTSLARTIDDLSLGETEAPRPGGAISPLVCTALATLTLIAFMIWLLLS
jgi:hypothetical protein